MPESPVSRIEEGTGVVTHGNATLSFYLYNASRSDVYRPFHPAAAEGRLRSDGEETMSGRDPITSGHLAGTHMDAVGTTTSHTLRRSKTNLRSLMQTTATEIWEGKGLSARWGDRDRFLVPHRVLDLEDHLFTLEIAAKLIASNISFVPVGEDDPDTFRLAVVMQIVQDSLWHRVVESKVGPLDESGLQFLIELVGSLVEREVNSDILARLVLPDVAHIKLVDPQVETRNGSVRIFADVKYV
jgi:LBP / BPI / CETP family, C-terminal domain